MSEVQKILEDFNVWCLCESRECQRSVNFAQSKQALYDLLMEKLTKDIKPKIDMDKSNGGYDCCGCSTYQRQYDDTVSIINELFGRTE